MADIAELTRLIEPHATAMGLRLVRVAMFGGKSDPTLQVMAERPDTRQLVIEDCAELSRRLSDMLDEVDPIEEAYRLEVSSPGIDRPLTRLSDYVDWAGFDARLKLSETIEGRKQVDGRLPGLDGEPFAVRAEQQVDGRLGGLEGETVIIVTQKTRETLHIPFTSIASAKLLLTDALIKATAPLSTEGAATILQER